MKNIVILGSSAASVKIIEDLKSSDPSCAVTLIPFDGLLPYRRDLFASMVAKSVTPEAVFCRPKEFYAQNNVQVIADKRIARINIKKQILFTEEKEQIPYDLLIIGDTPENRFPDIKGTNKTGVYALKKLKDIDALFNAIPLIDTVAVQTESLSGLQLACAIALRGKETIVVTSSGGFLQSQIDRPALEWLADKWAQAQLRILTDHKIEEILGEKDAKAVRISDGKVYSAQSVVFSESFEDFRLFKDTGIQISDHFNVDQHYRTNIQSIYAVDQTSGRKQGEQVIPDALLQTQGAVVAASINGKEFASQEEVITRDIDYQGVNITVIGRTETGGSGEYSQTFNPDTGVYERLYSENGQLTGAVIMNAGQKKEDYLQIIRESGPAPQLEPYKAPQADQEISAQAQNTDSPDISTELIDK